MFNKKGVFLMTEKNIRMAEFSLFSMNSYWEFQLIRFLYLECRILFLIYFRRAKEKRNAQLESKSEQLIVEKQEFTTPINPVKMESVESVPVAEKQSLSNIVKPTSLESPYSIVQQHTATYRGRPNFSAGKSRVRSASQEPKVKS